MGFFRIRRSIRLAPGIRLNLSKSGVSTSIGPHGATVNVGGPRGPRATVGVPGTGVSYTEQLGKPGHQPSPGEAPKRAGSGWRALGWIVAIMVVVSLVRFVLGLH
ncbi:MAG: DUF4236 domain-containing protein [Burkholderiales bacterium]|nr:DUF4236 domain-containing protein [Burkholderiales bacterium]